MKQQISPVVAVIAIVCVLAIAAFGWFRVAGVSHQGTPPPTMPPEVAKQWSQFANGAGAGRGTGGSIPSGQQGPTASPPERDGRPPGIPTGPGSQGGPGGGMPIGPPQNR